VERAYYEGRDLARAIDIEDLRRMARRRLPAFAFEYVDGGAEDERTLHDNRDAFGRWRFVHRILVDVADRSVAGRIFDRPAGLPLAIGPTGFNGILWRNGDIALAKAARAMDVPFTLSTVSSDSLAAVAKEAGGRLWFQLYIWKDDAILERLIARAEEHGCEALIVTLDAPMLGNRTWDQRNYARPLVLTLRAKLDVLRHLRWLFGVFLPRGLPGFGNIAEFLPPERQNPLDGARFAGSQMNPAMDWIAIAKLRERWKRKLVIKGLVSVDDAREAARLGLDGVVLSNHGGRQLDGDIATLEVLPEVVAAVGDRLEVMIDGGFRRGTDIVKAIALGARTVLLGRAGLYGLAAGGEAGATRGLTILRGEIDRTLGLLGCPSIDALTPALLRDRGR
jgi:(S)-mandelate dehydrogenase